MKTVYLKKKAEHYLKRLKQIIQRNTYLNKFMLLMNLESSLFLNGF